MSKIKKLYKYIVNNAQLGFIIINENHINDIIFCSFLNHLLLLKIQTNYLTVSTSQFCWWNIDSHSSKFMPDLVDGYVKKALRASHLFEFLTSSLLALKRRFLKVTEFFKAKCKVYATLSFSQTQHEPSSFAVISSPMDIFLPNTKISNSSNTL